MILASDDRLTYETFGNVLGLVIGIVLLVIALVTYRLRQCGRTMPREFPWAFAGYGVASLLNVVGGLVAEEAELVFAALSALLALLGFVGLIIGLRELRRNGAFRRS